MLKKSSVLLLLSITILGQTSSVYADNATHLNEVPYNTSYSTDVVGMQEQYLAPEYWLKKLPVEPKVLM